MVTHIHLIAAIYFGCQATMCVCVASANKHKGWEQRYSAVLQLETRCSYKFLSHGTIPILVSKSNPPSFHAPANNFFLSQTNTDTVQWGAGCLAPRTRNGRSKNSPNPGGTPPPTHPACSPALRTRDKRGPPTAQHTNSYSLYITSNTHTLEGFIPGVAFFNILTMCSD